MTNPAKACIVAIAACAFVGMTTGFVFLSVITNATAVTASCLLFIVAGATSALISYGVTSWLNNRTPKDPGGGDSPEKATETI